jgi:hypothetical protein
LAFRKCREASNKKTKCHWTKTLKTIANQTHSKVFRDGCIC